MKFVRKHVQPVLVWFKQAVTEPQHQLDRTEKTVRFAYDLCVHGARALRRDKAPQMAAAMSYRTLFALLPVVVVSTVLVRAVRGEDGFKSLVTDVLMSLDLYSWRVGIDEAGNEKSLGEFVEGLVSSATGLNYAALGWIGLAIVVYSAISLLVTIENGFNSIYGAPEGRSWVRRVPMYWLLLTMSPVFIGITTYLNRRFGTFIEGVHAWKWVLTFAKLSWGFCVGWLFMFILYKLVPNTKVMNRAALIGGFISALLLSTGLGGLQAYVGNAVSIDSLYGSLGLIPLFMFWMYLMWLFILFGLEVSATIQTLQGRSLEELEEKRPQNGLVDPASVLNLMEIVTERFGNGLATTARHVADETLINEAMVGRMIDRLVEAGILHRVETREGGAVTLSRPPQQISGDRLLEIGYSLVDEGGVGRQSALMQRLRESQKAMAAQANLAGLLAQNPAGSR